MKGKGYCSAQLAKDSVLEIREIMNVFDFDGEFERYDLHTTLMYDASNPEIEVSDDNINITATISGFDFLGEEKDAAVLVLDSKELTDLHNKFKDDGFKDSYPEFIAHVTLLYDATPKDKEQIQFIADLGAFDDIKIRFDKLKWEKIDDD